MSYLKDLAYRDTPFSSEAPQEDFFLYDAVSNLYTKCETNRSHIIKIRTVGILESINGSFYIKQMNTLHVLSSQPDPKQSIQVSVVHLEKPVRCTAKPYPVQLFGTLQWYNRPVIFAQIIQLLTVSVASRLNETLTRASRLHGTRHTIEFLREGTDQNMG